MTFTRGCRPKELYLNINSWVPKILISYNLFSKGSRPQFMQIYSSINVPIYISKNWLRDEVKTLVYHAPFNYKKIESKHEKVKFVM